MKFIVLIMLLLPQLSYAQDANLEERMKALEKKLAELQGEKELDIVKFHGQLTSTYDKIAVKETYPTPRDHDDLNYFRLRFSLDTFVDLDPKFKIYARMTTTKFFNRWLSEGTDTRTSDLDVSNKYSGPTVYLEKAYFDYTVWDDFVLSLGRLSTTEGGPSHLWDNQPRQAVYPMMNFNMPLDGIAFTYMLDRYLPPEQQLSLRMLYTPLTTVNLNGLDSYLDPPKQDVNGTTPAGNNAETTINAGAIQADYLAPKNSFTNQTNITWQHSILANFPRQSGVGTSDLKYTGNNSTLYLEFVGLWDSRFDFSATGTYSTLESTGLIAPGVGAGSTTDHTNAYGFGTLLDVRYRWTNWFMGYEYLHNTPLFFSFYSTDEDLINFYRTPGTGHHVYLSRKLGNFLTLRFGYRQKDLTNYLIGAGPIQDTDRDIKNFYVRLRADF